MYTSLHRAHIGFQTGTKRSVLAFCESYQEAGTDPNPSNKKITTKNSLPTLPSSFCLVFFNFHTDILPFFFGCFLLGVEIRGHWGIFQASDRSGAERRAALGRPHAPARRGGQRRPRPFLDEITQNYPNPSRRKPIAASSRPHASAGGWGTRGGGGGGERCMDGSEDPD